MPTTTILNLTVNAEPRRIEAGHSVADLVRELGLGGSVLLDPAVHRVGLALAILVGGVGLGVGIARHGKREPLGLGLAGLSLMALALLTGHSPAEAALTIAGVALVAWAHWRNVRHLGERA